MQDRTTGPAAKRRGQLLDANPVLWLAGRGGGSSGALWGLVIGASAVALIGWFLNAGSTSVRGTLFLAMIFVHMSLSIWVASEACHALGAARDSGALELLMSTPLTTKQILNGHLLALKQMFFWPVATLIGAELFILGADYYIAVQTDSADVPGVIGSGLALFMMFVAVLELRAVAAYGLWQGLTTKRPAHAVTKTVLHVILLPSLAIACYPLYPFIGLVKNLVFIGYGQDQLRRHFRAVLTERFGPTARSELVTDPSKRVLRGQLPPVLPR